MTTGIPGEKTIYQINRERAREILPAKTVIKSACRFDRSSGPSSHTDSSCHRHESRTTSLPLLTITHTEQRQGYQLKTIVFHSRSGMDLPAMLALPTVSHSTAALLITSEQPIDHLVEEGSKLDQAAHSGAVVLAMNPIPWPRSTDAERPTMGTMLPWTSRAFLVGKTFTGMRAEDMISAVQWLNAQHEVNPHEIDAYADGASGVALLHAAALDSTIRGITIEHTLSPISPCSTQTFTEMSLKVSFPTSCCTMIWMTL